MEIIRFESGQTYTGRLPGGVDSEVSITIVSRHEDRITLDNGKEYTTSIYKGSEFIRPWGDNPRTRPVFYAQEQDDVSEKEHWSLLEPNIVHTEGYRCAHVYYVGG